MVTTPPGYPKLAPTVLTTVHPSAVVRARDEDREAELAAFIRDLKKVRSYL